jgi:hypothetical protein
MKTLGGIFLIPCLAFTSFCKGQSITDHGSNILSSPVEAGTYSLVISEIMADPNPVVALPDAEYLEIFNRGPSPVSLAGYRLVIGDNTKILTPRQAGNPPAGMLEPGKYFIVCDVEDEPAFLSKGQTIPVSHLPSIVNTGATLVLESPSGKVIHSVSFTDKWYRSAGKAGGGWSLEMIDPDNPCGHAENWRESTDPTGGTPGCLNSVNAENPDDQRPQLLRASMKQDSSVVLYFSEDMDSVSLMDPLNYYATQGLLHPLEADPVEPAFSTVRLFFEGSLNSALNYTVTLLNTLNDCAGNLLQNNAEADFAIPQAADSFDIVINELLFDTPPGMSEFIELLNRSEKVIDLAGFSIASWNVNTDSVIRMTTLRETSFLLFPQRYVVFTRRANLLPDQDNRLDLSNVIELPSMFTLPDKEGKIAILNNNDHIMDMLYYNPSMHSIFIKEKEGISLERIHADLPTNEFDNWFSASFDKGYSTPGFKNSQEISASVESENITVSPAVFSPDGDGTDDHAILTLLTGGPGFIGNIEIYDMQGKKIATMCSNMLLGTETILSWDGKRNNGREAPIGMYLIYIEIFNQKGVVKKYRKVVTLVRRLND